MKSSLRKKMRALLKENAILDDGAEKARKENVFCLNFIKSDYFKKARIIFAYLSLNEELCVDMIIKEALKEGKKVCVPKVDLNTQTMQFYFLKNDLDLEKQIKCGAYNIREPLFFEDEHCAFNLSCVEMLEFESSVCNFSEDFFTICLVPALAFTRDGVRLGRGKGYYDKFLFDKNIFKIGVCFDFQILSNIPYDEHDVKMDVVF